MMRRIYSLYLRITKGVLRRLFYFFFGYFSKVVLRIADVVHYRRFLVPLARDFIQRARGYSYEFQVNGEYELVQKVVSRFEDLVFFDVGANVGDYCSTVLMASENGAIAHLFDLDSELNSKTVQRFKGLNVRVNNFGLSNRNEQIAYSRFPDFPAVNSLLEIEFSHLTKVVVQAEVRTGDSYCTDLGIGRINFLKMDVEGWERFVLEGFAEMLSANSIDALTWEYGYTTAETHWTTRDFYKYLEEKGYVCGVVRKQGIDFRPWEYDLNDYTSGPNFFACLPAHKDYFNLLSG
jgi:FkbM family methyltransferase